MSEEITKMTEGLSHVLPSGGILTLNISTASVCSARPDDIAIEFVQGQIENLIGRLLQSVDQTKTVIVEVSTPSWTPAQPAQGFGNFILSEPTTQL